jgi:hypothetical protein
MGASDMTPKQIWKDYTKRMRPWLKWSFGLLTFVPLLTLVYAFYLCAIVLFPLFLIDSHVVTPLIKKAKPLFFKTEGELDK